MLRLPYPDQLAAIDARLASGQDPGALLLECASLPDHGPLAFLLGRVAHRLAEPSLCRALGRLLDEAPETAAQRALASLPAGCPAPLIDEVAACCERLPLVRLPVAALALRWLRERDPGRRRRLHAEAVERCASALRRGEAPDDASLVLAPHGALRAAADGPALRAALGSFAARLLEALMRRPRTLSQASAEELLARRVYEGRGHFLFELLQNADDARASWVHFCVGPRELEVSHDGALFDALDVLGVLSVGQSTKDTDAIGSFGVGFKSVYAVAERPRVYSGAFCFEISGMGLPRPLAPPPGRDLGDTTLLALPLDRPGADPASLRAQAEAIPPEVLLTLRHVRALSVQGPAGDDLRYSVETSDLGATLSVEPPGRSTLFVYKYGESVQTMVAFATDERGLPRGLAPGAPAVYCHLPTREPSGLPFLLHGRFDVPLDRERLRRDSARNQALLSEAAGALAGLVSSLEGRRSLEALALLAEASPEALFRPMIEQARRLLAAAPLLPGAAGRPLAARAARLVPAALAAALAGQPLDGEGAEALAPLGERHARAARWLGARDFSASDLLALLERRLEALGEGDPLDDPLGAHTAALAAELARLPPAEAPRLAALAWVAVEVDGERRAYRPSSVRVASAEQAALYGGLRPLRVDDGFGGWEAVGVARLTPREVLADLRDAGLREALLRRGADRLLGYLAGLSPSQLSGADALPIFPLEGGGAGSLREAFGWPEGPLAGWLLAQPARRPPMLRRGLEGEHGALLRALGARRLEAAGLFTALRAGPPLDLDGARSLLEASAAAWRSWPAQALDELALTPLFADTRGRLWPLASLGKPSGDEALDALYERLGLRPQIGDEGARQAAALGLERRLVVNTPSRLVDDLIEGRIDASAHRAELLAVLARLAPALPPSQLASLRAYPLWRDRAGLLRPASEVFSGAAMQALLGEPFEPLLPAVASLALADEAPALASLFRPALDVLDEQARALARPGLPLDQQPPLLSTLDRALRLDRLARERRLEGWVTAIQFDLNLVDTRLWSATDDEALLLPSLRPRMAHPAWAAAQPSPPPPLPAAAALEALAAELRAAPLPPPRREALHRWLEGRAAEIEGSEQARGLLGKLPAFETREGDLRAPRALLLTAGLDDLPLPGRPSPAVPSPVLALLARLYRPEEASLEPLLEALIRAGVEAADAGDLPLLRRLHLALASATAPGPEADEHEARCDRLLRSLRAAKRLRFEAEGGALVRPRDLLLTSPERHALISRFHPSPRPLPAHRDELAPLLARLGAPAELGADELRSLLEASSLGPEASLALARYVAEVAVETPSLRQHLDLDRAPWVPSAAGDLRPPSRLYWPEPGLDELLSPTPREQAHPIFARTAPPSLGRWLRFRRPSDASFEEFMRGRDPASRLTARALRWLEQALLDGRLTPSDLRRAFADRAAFALADEARHPRLLAALSPPRRPEPRADTRPAPSTSPAPAATPATPTATPATPARPQRKPSPEPRAAPAPAPPPEPAPRKSFWQKLFGSSDPEPRPEPPARSEHKEKPPGPPGARPWGPQTGGPAPGAGRRAAGSTGHGAGHRAAPGAGGAARRGPGGLVSPPATRWAPSSTGPAAGPKIARGARSMDFPYPPRASRRPTCTRPRCWSTASTPRPSSGSSGASTGAGSRAARGRAEAPCSGAGCRGARWCCPGRFTAASSGSSGATGRPSRSR